jgi:hypothetical protein
MDLVEKKITLKRAVAKAIIERGLVRRAYGQVVLTSSKELQAFLTGKGQTHPDSSAAQPKI